jgi:hypothetical protein
VRYDEYCGHGSCRNFAELSYYNIEELDYLTSYKIESFYAFPFYLSIFSTRFQYIDYLRIQVWYPHGHDSSSLNLNIF